MIPASSVPIGRSAFLIPLVNVPQSFNIILGTTQYVMTSKWNDSANAGWVLDIADFITSTVLACNIPLIVGADLLSGLEYLGIAGSLIVYTDGDEFAVPTLANLGSASNLYFEAVTSS